MLLSIFFLALIVGFISARTGMIESRGDQMPTTLPRTILSAASMLVTLSLFAWGVITQAWYVPITAFLAGSVIAGLLVTRTTWIRFYKMQPITQSLAILASAYLWLIWLDKGAA